MNVSQHNTGTVIKGDLLTSISWMIPLIVAAGICIALGQVIGGPDVGQKTGSGPWMLNQIGGSGIGLIVLLISAEIPTPSPIDPVSLRGLSSVFSAVFGWAPPYSCFIR